MKIAFIGGGNMGEAMVSAILKKGLSTPHSICVSDISNTRRQHLEPEVDRTQVALTHRAVPDLEAVEGQVVQVELKAAMLVKGMRNHDEGAALPRTDEARPSFFLAVGEEGLIIRLIDA